MALLPFYFVRLSVLFRVALSAVYVEERVPESGGGGQGLGCWGSFFSLISLDKLADGAYGGRAMNEEKDLGNDPQQGRNLMPDSPKVLAQRERLILLQAAASEVANIASACLVLGLDYVSFVDERLTFKERLERSLGHLQMRVHDVLDEQDASWNRVSLHEQAIWEGEREERNDV